MPVAGVRGIRGVTRILPNPHPQVVPNPGVYPV
jgi:hypothetical protein